MNGNQSENAYIILETLHKSRRYSVYKAKNQYTGNLVSIKTNVQRMRVDQILLQQMKSEVEAGLQLQHPHIRKTLNIFQDGPAVFMVSDFVEGVSLSTLLNTPKLDISYEHALKWILQLLDALDHAHALHVWHLNLNPSHILITPGSDVKLFGFGKGPTEWKYAEAAQDRLHPVLFTAPEQFMGREPDGRADIYSLGVLAYLLLCGQFPWSLDLHETPTQQKQQTFQRPVSDPEILGARIPHWLFTVLNKCLMLDPARRFATPAEMLQALSIQQTIPFESCLAMPAPEVPARKVVLESLPELQKTAESEPALQPETPPAKTPETEGQLEIPGLAPVVTETPAAAVPRAATPTQYQPPPPSKMQSAPVQSPRPTQPAVLKQPPVQTRQISELKKYFSVLKVISLLILAYIIVKYVIISDKPKFSKVDDSEEIAPSSRDFAVKNEPLSMIPIDGAQALIGHIGPEADDDEFPPREVALASYQIGAYEVTRREWAMATPGFVVDNSEEDLPMVDVTFYEVLEYCNEKSRMDGLKPCYEFLGDNVTCDFSANGYRLPTEAEWEYAARSSINGDFTLFSGSNAADEVAWYADNSDGKIHRVGKKDPNTLGLFDMSGNAAEWVWNWYLRYSSGMDLPHTGPDSGTDKVIRGGSWKQEARELRVTNRSHAKPLIQRNDLGFRVARSK